MGVLDALIFGYRMMANLGQQVGVTRQVLNAAAGCRFVDNVQTGQTDLFVDFSVIPAGGPNNPVFTALVGGSSFNLPATGGIVWYDTTLGPAIFNLPIPKTLPQSLYTFVDAGTYRDPVTGILSGGLTKYPAEIVNGPASAGIFNPDGPLQNQIKSTFGITQPFSSYSFASVPAWFNGSANRSAYWAQVAGVANLLYLGVLTAGTYALPPGQWLVMYDSTNGPVVFVLPGLIVPTGYTFVDVGTQLVGGVDTGGLANFGVTLQSSGPPIRQPWSTQGQAGYIQNSLQSNLYLNRTTCGPYASNVISLAPTAAPYWAATG